MAILPFGSVSGANRVKKAGDTMTGTLNIDPANAATKGLVIQRSSTENSIFAQAVDYYKLDEATATTAIDTLDSIPLTANGTTVVTGALNNARSFNGSSDYLYATTLPITTVTNWSISAWIKAASTSQAAIAVKNGNGNGGFGFGITDGGGGTGNKLSGLLGAVAWINTGFAWPDTTTWHHVVMTRNATTTTIYFDASSKGTSASTPNTPSSRVSIGDEMDGSNNPSRYFNGAIDEVGFWPICLTSAQVTTLYNSGTPIAPSSNLLEWQDSLGNIIAKVDALGNFSVVSLTQSSPLVSYLPLTGGTLTGNIQIGTGGNTFNPTITFDMKGNTNPFIEQVDDGKLYIGNSNLGVGESNPTEVLSVNGNLLLNGGSIKTNSGTNLTFFANLARVYINNNRITFGLGGTYFDHYADAGNTHTDGVTYDSLYSDTTAANTLATNGDKLKAEYAGIFVSSATATREIQVLFGGTVILDTGALTTSAADSWDINVLIIRESSTVVRCQATINVSTSTGTGGFTDTTYTRITGLTLTGTNILLIQAVSGGVGAAANDIVAKLGTVMYFPAV